MVRFAVVGCGNIGRRHAEIANGLAKLEAVCDVKEDRAIKLASTYECMHYSNLGELLEDEREVDVVSICTPNGLHAEQTVEALRMGKHVICEKPMALSRLDCLWMMEEEKSAGKTIFVVKQSRYNPPVVTVKKAIDAGWFGKILDVQLTCFWSRPARYYQESDWRGTLRLDGGTLYTQFSHFIDIMLWIVGDVKEFYVLAKNLHHPQVEFEDTTVIALEFMNGALGTINLTVNNPDRNTEGSITISGEKGIVKIGGECLNVLEYQDVQDHHLICLDSQPANDYGFYQGAVSNHDRIYKNVLATLEGKEMPVAPSREGMRSVEFIENIYSVVRCS